MDSQIESADPNVWLNVGTILGLVLVGVMAKWDAYKASKVRNDIHTLVNSNMGIQLRLNAAMARRIAGITNSPEDEIMARDAEALWAEHQVKQRIVDAGKKMA